MPDWPTPGRPGSAVLVATHLYPTSDRDIRGPWVAEQVDELRALVDVRVLCCSQAASDGVVRRPSGVEVTYRGTRTPFGQGRPGLIASSFLYDRALGGYLRRHPEIGLVHAHFGFPDAVIAHRRTRTPHRGLVVTLHGDDALRVLPRGDLIGRAVRRAVEAADAVLCVSGAMAQVVQGLVPTVEPAVITNGYDDRLFRLSDRPRDLGLLFVGMFVPVKNLPILLEAYGRAAARLPHDLTLAGDGPLRAELEAQAAALSLAGRVHFLGAQSRPEVAALMQRASALLLPSRSEGWPLVVAEALACGTPVVASRVGGIPEIVGADAGGILVPAGDPAALADALVEISGRPADPPATAAASNAHPWRVQAARIADIYAAVLDGAPAASRA